MARARIPAITGPRAAESSRQARPRWRDRLLVLALLLLAATRAEAATVSIACGSVGPEFERCRREAQAWAARTGTGLTVVSTPKDSNEALAFYQQFLAARSSDLDVLRIDVVWPGLLAEHLADLGPFVPGSVPAQHFPAIIENNTVGGRLVALPWFADAGLLYYRADLLEKHGRKPPDTWEELTETARVIQEAERAAGRSRMQGFVFQGRPYEGLTCNALEWVASSGGGTVVDAEGKVTIANPRAVRALELAASWVGTIAPVGVLNYAEEEARGAFQSGNAVFMRNWPYAWALANAPDSPVKGKVGVGPLPRGADGGAAAVLGGWQLAVSRYSRNQAAAADLVVHLTGREVQKRAAIEASLNPTIPALYRDPEVLKAAPFLGRLLAALEEPVARPSRATGGKYNRVSAAFWNAVHDVLSGRSTAEESLARLERRLERLRRGGRW